MDTRAKTAADSTAAKLDRTAERMRSVVDHVVDGIITIDANGAIETFNPAAERIFGYPADEAIGRNVRMLMPEPDSSLHDGYVAHYLRTGEKRIIGVGRTVVGRRRDGSVFPMELAISEFAIGGQRYFTGIVRDITARVLADEELKRAHDELKLADVRKDEFLSMLAHELRNPLAPIRTALALLEREPLSERGARVLGMSRRQLLQLTRLVDDLLEISRVTRGMIELRLERVAVHKLLRDVVEGAAPMFEERRQWLSLHLPDAPLALRADPVRLAQVVENLLANASKYTDAGGRIELRAGRRGTEVAIEVRDSGIGIAAEDLPRLFQPFTQIDTSLERSRGGLGIGLALVRHLVELHGGRVAAASPGLGRGAVFTVRLPAVSETVA